MSIPTAPPPWNRKDKDGSLGKYAAWINQIARGAFLEDGCHPHMFLFVTEKGEIKGCQFRDGLPQEQRNAVIRSEASRIKPFGTIQILIKTIYDLKLTSNPKLQKVRFIGAVDSEPEILSRDCLLIIMLSRTGRDKHWANPIIQEGDRLALMDTVEVYPVKEASSD